MATLLSLLDIDDAPKTAGRDLTPLLGNDKVTDWHDITYMRLGNWKAAVSDWYKLVVDSGDSLPWLLDLQEDPDEQVNYTQRSQVHRNSKVDGPRAQGLHGCAQ